MKNKYAQSQTDAFSEIIKSSNPKTNLLETDDGKDYVKKNSIEFLNNNDIKRYSRNNSLGAVFAERFNRTIRNLINKPVFLKGNAEWISELPSIIKQYNRTIDNSTKMKPVDASKKTNNKKTLFHSSRSKI